MKVDGVTFSLDELQGSEKSEATQFDPDAYKILSLRFGEVDFLEFTEQVEAMGYNRNLALRVAARRICGYLEIDTETRRLLRQISIDIGEISLSLVKLARIARHNDTVDVKQLSRCHDALAREFAVLDDKLQTLLNVSKRRIDGRVLMCGSMIN